MKINIKKLIIILISLCIVLLIIPIIRLISYKLYRNRVQSRIESCYNQDKTIYSVDEIFAPGNNGCFKDMCVYMFPELLIYKSKTSKKDSEIVDLEVFSIAKKAYKKSAAVLCYGFGGTLNFEMPSAIYGKPTYSFDCGYTQESFDKLVRKNDVPNLHFESKCIGSDKYLMYNQKSSHKVVTLGQQLKEMGLENEMVYLKFGIPEVYRYMPDVLKYKDNISGISIIVDLFSPKYVIETIRMLDLINKDFILISRKPLYAFASYKLDYSKSIWGAQIALTYINKDLVDNYTINWNQDYYLPKNKSSSIDFIVTLYEKLRIFKNDIKKHLF